MYKGIGIIAGAMLANGIGSALDPDVLVKVVNIIYILVGSAGIGLILGAIADGVSL